MKDRFLRACWREPVDRTPVWFMRQAGRSSAAYRTLRAEHGMLELARDPKLAAQITLQPVTELEVDAAILFSDLLLPLEAMGATLAFEEGGGPRLSPPIRKAADIERLRSFHPGQQLAFVLETIRRVRTKTDVPLIGFAGAPFTLASYLIEGGVSQDFLETKRFLHAEPDAWKGLMARLTEDLAAYLRAQAEAGAQALQVFDSWAGALSPFDYATQVAPWSARLLRSLKETDVPVIHFGTNTAGFLEAFRSAGGDVIGVDWRVPLDEAWQRIGEDRAIQGNLDPAALLGPAGAWRAAAGDVLRRADGRPGHVFNLGHGVLPQTPREALKSLVQFVHDPAGN